MVEDTPQRPRPRHLRRRPSSAAHPLGRPVIGRAGGDPRACHGGRSPAITAVRIGADNDRAPLPRATSAHDELVALLEAREERTSGRSGLAARKPARVNGDAGRALPAEGHRAVPRLPQRAWNLAPRRAPLRCVADWTRSSAARPRRASSRRSARSAGWRTRSTATRRSTPRRGTDRRLRRHARGQPRRVPRRSPSQELADIARAATCATASSRARRRTSRAGILLSLGVDLGADDAAREVTITDTPLS